MLQLVNLTNLCCHKTSQCRVSVDANTVIQMVNIVKTIDIHVQSLFPRLAQVQSNVIKIILIQNLYSYTAKATKKGR